MASGVPPWSICVITHGTDDYGLLNNALLYGDEVAWASHESALAASVKSANMTAHMFTHIADMVADSELIEPKTYHFAQELAKGTDGIAEGIDAAVARLSSDLDTAGLLGCVKQVWRGDAVSGYYTQSEQFRNDLETACHNSRVVLEGPRTRVSSAPAGEWDSYYVAGRPMSAMSSLLLPDVSGLPLEVIADLRDRLKDALDPMRAEMLRFTEEIRKLAGAAPYDTAALDREARNLIATRVEPVIRETDHRLRELADKKWRKLFSEAAKAFGFAGAAYVDPKLLAKAIQKTLEVGTLAFGDVEDRSASGKASAQFVLQARTFLTRNAC